MANPILYASLTILTALITSSGLWAYLQKRDVQKDAVTKLMMGLAYERISFLGMHYITRGWITREEYRDFRKYFYDPYVSLGGNGVAEKILEEIKRLDLRDRSMYTEITEAKKEGEERNGSRH